jgi:DNA-binding NarL/FixJ family response regulator
MAETVLIADDHPAFRSSARALLEAAGYVVVGEAADAASARSQARTLTPQVLLLDIQLPDGDGISLAQEISAWRHPPRIVLISGREQSEFGSRLGASRACGFIPKAELSRSRLERTLAAGA